MSTIIRGPREIPYKDHTIFAIQGVPNIGKTTFVNKNLSDFPRVSGDDIFKEIYERRKQEILKLYRSR